jgi:hypothetical protein
MTHSIRLRLAATLLTTIGAAAAARADLPAAKLSTVFPPGAQKGTFAEVTVAGADLDELAELRFSHPAITAKPALDAAGKVQPNKFVVAVWPDVPPGVYEARAVGRFGVSNPRAFAVGDVPESNEGASNTSPGGATEVAVGSLVNGQCAAGAVDHFRFAAKRGQRVLIHCAAGEIDSKAAPVLTLLDPAGRELDRSRTGDVLDFTAPADAQYVLQVADAVFRGGPEYAYRLTISAGPHVDFVLPPAGVAGAKAKHVLYGRNLPGGAPAPGVTLGGKPLEQLAAEVELPAAPPAAGTLLASPSQSILDGIAYRVRGGHAGSNPVLVAVADAPPAAEQSPNDKPAEAQKLAAPFEAAGQFFPRGDRDWYSFDAKKGDVYWVEVFSQRLGQPCDPFLLVQRVTKNEKGEEQSADVQEVYDGDTNAGGIDFNTATRDPAYRLEAKEDGTYRVQVRDLFNTMRDDPRLVYRLSVRREKPDFRLAVMPVKPAADLKELPGPPLLRRGGSVPVRVVALRRDGFAGEIALSVEGLPPGVTCAGGSVGAGNATATLLLTAAEDAAGWAGPVRVVGKARVGGADVVREARGATVLWAVPDAAAEAVRSRLTGDGLAVAVSAAEAAPLSIAAAGAAPLEVAAGAKLKIPLKLNARAGPAGKLKAKPAGDPSLDRVPEVEIDGAAKEASLELDLNQHKLPPGTHTLYVRAEGPVKYLRNPEALKAAEEAKQKAEKSATDAAAAAKDAGEKLAAAKKGTDAEATKAAEKLAAETDAKSKEAEKQKQAAVKAAADAGPKDTAAVTYSAPIVVKVTAPAPAPPPAPAAK